MSIGSIGYAQSTMAPPTQAPSCKRDPGSGTYLPTDIVHRGATVWVLQQDQSATKAACFAGRPKRYIWQGLGAGSYLGNNGLPALPLVKTYLFSVPMRTAYGNLRMRVSFPRRS